MKIKNVSIIIFIFIVYVNIVDSAIDVTNTMHIPTPTATGTKYIYNSGEWYPENQLFVNISGNLSVGNYSDINVKTAIGDPVLCAEIYFDDIFVGCTDREGHLNHKLTKTGSYSLTVSKSGYLKVVTPVEITGVNNLYIICQDNNDDTDNETNKKNLVLVVDSSGSTAINNIAGLIHKASTDIINDITYDNIGIVSFGGTIETKEISDKYELEDLTDFINNLDPNAGGITDLNQGLIYAERFLSSVNGNKEIIVISDGYLYQDNENVKKVAIKLKNQGVNITYVQILTDFNANIPNSFYENLANSSSSTLIVLKPAERIGDILINDPYFDINDNDLINNDKCFVKKGDAILINVIADDGLSQDAEINIDERAIGKTFHGKLVYVPTEGIHNITANKRGYKTAYKTIETLSNTDKPKITTQPINTIGTINITDTANETTDRTIEKSPGFGIILTIGIFFVTYVFKRRK